MQVDQKLRGSIRTVLVAHHSNSCAEAVGHLLEVLQPSMRRVVVAVHEGRSLYCASARALAQQRQRQLRLTLPAQQVWVAGLIWYNS